MREFNKKELKEKFINIKKAFKSFNDIETQGRKYIQKAIIGCYDIYLHYNANLIQRRCDKLGITYKHKKPMKMILMIALKVSDNCDDERIKARIRTYVRVLKHFVGLNYDIKEAQEELDKFGIDYCANPRTKEEEVENYENQLEFDFGDKISNNDENDTIEEDMEDEEDCDTQLPHIREHTTLSNKIVQFLRANDIKDENYVIWVVDGKAYKCTDTGLLEKLKQFDFLKLE